MLIRIAAGLLTLGSIIRCDQDAQGNNVWKWSKNGVHYTVKQCNETTCLIKWGTEKNYHSKRIEVSNDFPDRSYVHGNSKKYIYIIYSTGSDTNILYALPLNKSKILTCSMIIDILENDDLIIFQNKNDDLEVSHAGNTVTVIKKESIKCPSVFLRYCIRNISSNGEEIKLDVYNPDKNSKLINMSIPLSDNK